MMPLTEKYLTMLRDLFPKTKKQAAPALIPIESAGAIAAVARYYQSFDLPKGAVQGSPPVPDDDMKTLHIPLYLVASKKLSDDVVAALAKAIMDARRDLIGEYPPIEESANRIPTRPTPTMTPTFRRIRVPLPISAAMSSRFSTSTGTRYSTARCC